MKKFTACLFAMAFNASTAWASNYGCALLDEIDGLSVVEGHGGVFFRVQPDLRMYYHFPLGAVDLLGELSDALSAHGTKLIYLPVPTKGLVMPEALSEETSKWKYDPEVASEVFDSVVESLEATGVTSTNLRTALRDSSTEGPPYYPTDYHWNSTGARRAAAAIAERIDALPDFKMVERGTFETEALEDIIVPSALRPLIQARCRKTIPIARDTLYLTSPVIDQGATLDLFGTGTGPRIVLVGTSFSAFEFSNFSGWLSESTGFDVENRSVVGGNSYAAIVSYLLGDYIENPPEVLIWENPVYNNLFDHGDRTLRELVFAAQADCSFEQQFEPENPLRLHLRADSYQETALRIETTSPTRQIDVTYTFEDGTTTRETFRRGQRTDATSRFYVPLIGLHEAPVGLTARAVGAAEVESIALCPSPPAS